MATAPATKRRPGLAAPPRTALAAVQGLYDLATGVWPLVHIDSFLLVTGPKNDLWLVRTVGVVIAAIGLALLVAAWRREPGLAVPTLAVASAAGLTAIDVIYVVAGVIAPIYLADAAAEVVLIAAWGVVLLRRPTD